MQLSRALVDRWFADEVLEQVSPTPLNRTPEDEELSPTTNEVGVCARLVFSRGRTGLDSPTDQSEETRGDAMEHREPGAEPPPAAVTFVTTEHFTLQGARSSTVAEATGRATMFLGAVSGGLVALGLIATAAGVNTAFYAFALILLPTLALVGLATFNRALQSGIEDFGYASRIARLRGYYFQYAPELVDYLTSVPPTQRLGLQGLEGGRWQRFFTVSGTVALVTAVLAGSAAGLLAAVVSDHVLVAAVIAGIVVGIAVFAALIQVQVSTWRRAAALLLDDV